MMASIARLQALSSFERRLLVEALFALALASIAVAMLPFRTIGKFAVRRSSGAIVLDDRAVISQVGWAVRAGARRVPFRAKCFEQGLAAWWMLRRRGMNATLHYGAARRESLVAHVWVTAGDQDVIGCENKDRFAELARLRDLWSC